MVLVGSANVVDGKMGLCHYFLEMDNPKSILMGYTEQGRDGGGGVEIIQLELRTLAISF